MVTSQRETFFSSFLLPVFLNQMINLFFSHPASRLHFGANEFFYLDETRIREWGIEREFLKPVIKSPRECKRILIDPKELKYKIFMCHKDKKDLKGTAALEYIKWGESKRFHERPTCASQARWWQSELEMANSIFVKEANDTSAVFHNPANYPVDCRLYCANLPEIPFLFLNSPIAAMMFEIYNRAGLGEGARSMMVSDYDIVPCLRDGLGATEARTIILQLSSLQPRILYKRQRDGFDDLDNAIFDIMNLTQSERNAVYEAVIDLIEARLKKAESLNSNICQLLTEDDEQS